MVRSASRAPSLSEAIAERRILKRSTSVAATYCRAFDCDIPPEILETRSLDERCTQSISRSPRRRPIRISTLEDLYEEDSYPPTPPTIIVNDEDAQVSRGRPKLDRLSSFRTMLDLPRRLVSKISMSRKQETKQPSSKDEEAYDFIRDRRVRKRTSTQTIDGSIRFMMSGALPHDNVDISSRESFIFSSPALSDSENLPSPPRERSSSSDVSFNSSFRASDSLQLPGFQARSDVFSRQSIHLLSECITPEHSHFEPANHPFCRRTLVEDGANDQLIEAASGSGAKLPTELIQSIYWYLSPYDFNAARHTCHKWMVASLELKLLSEQIKRGGWWASAQRRPALFSDWRRAWPTSCFLARESALAGNWAGQESGLPTDAGSSQNSPFTEFREFDFDGLRRDERQSSASVPEDGRIVCAVSLCGKFFLVAAGCEIFTYAIEGLIIRLLSRTSCEQKVLALSVDVSSQRFMIAALLEGRIGLLFDLRGTNRPSPSGSPWESAARLGSADSEMGQILDFGDGAGPAPIVPVRDIPVGDFDELSLNAASVGSNRILHQSVEIVTERQWAQYLHGPRARLRGMRQMPASSNGVWPGSVNFRETEQESKKAEAKLRSQIVYRNICTEEDPPTSIAVSPTRQCVAFGCKSGVELYWVDLTTGQNLNRWFPLTKPSDHLYFLPPRRNVDSALRLRLISTAAFPEGSGYLESNPATPSSQTTFWFTLSASWRFPIPRVSRRQTNAIDHSYALPLSDGHHILFTDNETGFLYLGSDRPIGSTQRLSRKFAFQPPLNLLTSNMPHIPTTYAATTDAGGSLRVVAGFGDEVVLYSVPVDALEYSTAEQEQTLQDSSKSFGQLEWMNVLQHPTSNAQAFRDLSSSREFHGITQRLNMLWAHYLPSSGEDAPSSLDQLWPLKVCGTSVGRLGDLKTLVIQETASGGLVVWAFSKTGVAKAWRLDDGKGTTQCTRIGVDLSGLVLEDEIPTSVEAEGDSS